MAELVHLGFEPQDFYFALEKIEKSLGINIDYKKINSIKTFGELCDLIIDTINLPHINGSTEEQAFDKLRNAIAITKNIDKEKNLPETKLIELFPRRGRRKAIRKLEFELGFDLNVLRPYLVIEAFFFFFLIGSVIAIFLNFIYGLGALALLILMINIAFKTGKEFNCDIVGGLSKKIVEENYRQARKNSHAINNKEVIALIKNRFGDNLIGSGKITRETKIW